MSLNEEKIGEISYKLARKGVLIVYDGVDKIKPTLQNINVEGGAAVTYALKQVFDTANVLTKHAGLKVIDVASNLAGTAVGVVKGTVGVVFLSAVASAGVGIYDTTHDEELKGQTLAYKVGIGLVQGPWGVYLGVKNALSELESIREEGGVIYEEQEFQEEAETVPEPRGA